ncbi:DUF4365 domain-containing protein [Bdellovibrio sp.]|uniref:DUF4365 domain-containing protein n=1 Tax=Bdellovibrio sp. TaxID=28201 RepID=UPI00322216F2
MEKLSVAYCKAVISYAGCSFDPPDYDAGLDGYISAFKNYNGKVRAMGALLAIQIKATTTMTYNFTTREFTFTLKREDFDRLIEVSAQEKILVVYNLPTDQNLWVRHSRMNLSLHRAAYYIEVERLKHLTPSRTSVTIKIPDSNLFDSNAVSRLVQRTAANLGINLG